MPGSESYGDSDDDALLIAATQKENEFEPSPRPAKRPRRSSCTSQSTSSEACLEIDPSNDETLEAGKSPDKRQHLQYAPQFVANLDRVILNQTQAAPASQPWEIRGPVWKRPKPKTPEKKSSIAGYFSFAQRQSSASGATTSKSLAQVIVGQKTNEPQIEIGSAVEYVPGLLTPTAG